ncbi:hypothetical protein INP51_06935 [Blautia liquoris]|uniref:Peptidase M14 domain-containing protein n=1 Tax=Blautia liquoris TaxID=2779518 RepID=A0A7M2RMS8_9FIRM|nr:M14 family zinc carboxypeptidase [Blautia liquoris]QOV20662.1 hypothetical protein INP51_06935 [Blautia liquoris]
MINLNQHFSYQDIVMYLQMLADQFPEFTIYRSIGISHDEREIPMMRIGFGMETLICTAGIHGKENINPPVFLKMIEDYCMAYHAHRLIEGIDVHTLLNQYSICFIPLLNPDGYEIAMYGFDAIHNQLLRRMCRRSKIHSKDWKYNAKGVDINRNFPSRSYIQQQLSEYPASEPETKALIGVFRDYETLAYLDFHSSGNVIYYYRQAMPYTYNIHCRHLASALTRISGFALGKKEEEFMSSLNGGNSVHFYSESTGRPAITVETVKDDASYPLSIAYQSDTYRQIHRMPLALLRDLRPMGCYAILPALRNKSFPH